MVKIHTLHFLIFLLYVWFSKNRQIDRQKEIRKLKRRKRKNSLWNSHNFFPMHAWKENREKTERFIKKINRVSTLFSLKRPHYPLHSLTYCHIIFSIKRLKKKDKGTNVNISNFHFLSFIHSTTKKVNFIHLAEALFNFFDPIQTNYKMSLLFYHYFLSSFSFHVQRISTS